MNKPSLKKYQERAIAYGLRSPYCILALDPGLGKSRCAIEIRDRLDDRCLVICPSYLIDNWGKEIAKWGNSGVKTTLFKSGKQLKSPKDADFVVTSYDLVQKAPYLFEWADMVVLDEAHAIKSMKAKRTQFIHKHIYENSIKRLYLLTGTPIKNRVQEFYSLLALCFYNPRAADVKFLDLYPSELHFADRFAYREQFEIDVGYRRVTIVKWHGIRNTEELKIYLGGRYLRIKSKDVLDLPPVVTKTFQVSDVDDPLLLEAFNNYFSEGEDREDRTSSILPEHKAMAALKKVPFTIKYVENLLEEVESVLVYSDHIQPAEEIAKHFGVTALTGKIPASRRSQMADDFQNGQGNILVCTVGSMKEGKDLFRSQHIVFNDFPWVPGDLKQVIYRIQRIGQKSTCFVHKIVGSPQDGYIMDVLEEKMKVIEAAT